MNNNELRLSLARVPSNATVSAKSGGLVHNANHIGAGNLVVGRDGAGDYVMSKDWHFFIETRPEAYGFPKQSASSLAEKLKQLPDDAEVFLRVHIQYGFTDYSIRKVEAFGGNVFIKTKALEVTGGR